MTLEWDRQDREHNSETKEGKKSTESSSARQNTSTSSPFENLDEEPARHSSASGSPRIQHMNKGESRVVHFSDAKGLELTQAVQGDTYYPTPQIARSIVHNGSLRRFTADEVELYFSEDVRRYPVSQDDYAVKKLQDRCDILAIGCMELMKKNTILLSKWKKCRAELHHGILILCPQKDGENSRKKRTIIPVASCDVDFAMISDHRLEITFVYQLETVKRCVRFESMTAMFMWWWAIQLASKCHCDSQQLHHAIQNTSQQDRRTSKKSQGAISSTSNNLSSLTHSLHIHATPTDREGMAKIQEGIYFPRTLLKKNGKYRRKAADFEPGTPEQYRTRKKFVSGVTHLLLIRHAETENIQFRVSDRDKYLTERGRRQAEKTAQYVEKQLREVMATDDNVELIYGGLLRSVETAQIFHKQIPWLRHSYHCCFLEDGAPKEIGPLYRQEYRNAMHKMAFEFICHWDAFEDENMLTPLSELEKYKIVICHTSFIQYCLAQCYQISKDIIQLGAPIAHCSISQIDIKKEETMTASFSNRVTHLPLVHRTTD